MRIVLNDKNKKELFVSLFQVLKNCTNIINVIFKTDKLYIQGMDKSHVCLFECNILDSWFQEYTVLNETNVSFDTGIFHMIISSKHDSHDIIIHDENNNSENLKVDLVTQNSIKGEFNKYFKIPYAEYDYEQMNIPDVDYDAEFSISSKQICEIVSQMMIFGSDINIYCSEEKINLITNGIAGEMLVNIPIDDLSEYSIVENETIDLSYSLSYINKMCLTNKLTNEIHFHISSEYPMKLKYDLGNDSSLIFYIAPKIKD
jgi:proliferating cell nuclear antigen PCNA